MTARQHPLLLGRRVAVRMATAVRSFEWARRTQPLSATLLALALLAGVWELAARALNVRFLPPFTSVAVRFGEIVGDVAVLEALASSLVNLAIGFVISVVVGVGIGVLMALFEAVELALSPIVYALFTAPSIVFAPIFFSIFGLGTPSIVAVVITYAIFVIIINTVAAIQTVPGSLVEMAESFQASRFQIFRKIMLPAAAPLILAGVRVGAGSAVKGMINGEMFIAVVGLGAMVMAAGRAFDSTSLLAILILIVIVAFASIWAVQFVDRRLTSWLPPTARQ